MSDDSPTPRVSETYLTWQADAAQAREMCAAAAAGMRPQAFDLATWHVYQAMARLFERFEAAFKEWPKKPHLTFEEKSADIRALESLKAAAVAMIEARRLK